MTRDRYVGVQYSIALYVLIVIDHRDHHASSFKPRAESRPTPWACFIVAFLGSGVTTEYILCRSIQ